LPAEGALMSGRTDDPLSRRERQIMEVVYRRGQATAAEVLAELPDPPTKTAVRTLLRILEDKGQVRHRREGLTYVYLPCRPREQAARSALRGVLQTFFGGSLVNAVAAHLGEAGELSAEELERLAELIRQARKKGK
jgi:predicted transcriptional regulator